MLDRFSTFVGNKIPMTNKSSEILISEGKKHFIESALAAIFFAAFFYTVFLTLYYCIFEPRFADIIINLYNIFGLGLISLSLGLRFATVKTILIDTSLERLISRYHIGPFSIDRLSSIPQLEYVAVFLNAKELHEVNLWYKGDRHYKMYVFEDKYHAFRFAEMVTQKLQLDLLDATQKGNSKWIERPAT